jgi:hypothetical protein
MQIDWSASAFADLKAIYEYIERDRNLKRRPGWHGDRRSSFQTTVAPGSVRTAWNGGEMLSEEQADIFRSAFHRSLLNRYGGRELSTMACQYTDGGRLVVLRPWLMVDVVNEQGKPAAPGESGRLLWTSTVWRGTPLLRYEVEDWDTFGPVMKPKRAEPRSPALTAVMRACCVRRMARQSTIFTGTTCSKNFRRSVSSR